jgi:uncharacterized protein YndB with AHSA1/START domain
VAKALNPGGWARRSDGTPTGCRLTAGARRLTSGSPQAGAVAQLGERRVRNAEVRGSSPLGSTKLLGTSGDMDQHRVGQTIEIRQPIVAPRTRIWAALTEPEGIACWQADRASGRVVCGGSVTLGYPALGAEVELAVEAVEPERRLVFSSGRSLAEFLVGETEVVLRHQGLEPGDELDGTASSWRVSLALLAHYLEKHDGRPRQTDWFVRRVRTTPAAAYCFFTQSAALGAWLGTGNDLGHPSDPIRLRLVWGETLTGRVLARTPDRDVALSWNEHGDSALVLRTLPVPAGPNDRLLIVNWSRWAESEAPPRTRARLEAACQRLATLLGSAARA